MMLNSQMFPSTHSQRAVNPVRMREIDYRAIRYLIQRSRKSESLLKLQRELDKLDKAWKAGQLYVPREETQDQKWWRCEARFLLGDYSDWGGWQYRDPMATRFWFENPHKCPVWKGGRVKRLAVVGEQGLGDEVFFANCLYDLRDRVDEIVLETAPRLVSVFKRSLGIDAVPAKFRPSEIYEGGEERVIQEPYNYGADEWVTLADLGRVMRHEDKDFHRKPYITAAPEQIERFKALKGRVGISWRGAQGEIAWKQLLAQFPDAVSLQYDQSWDEEVERPKVDLKNDIEGILGVLANLDRVVTVSTTVAHFAAAMGVNTEVRLARVGSGRRSQLTPFKWVNRKHKHETLWYPKTTRTFEFGEWV
jgi:hypothetical protein